MLTNYDCRIRKLRQENAFLRSEIDKSKNQRRDASKHSERLAEANSYLDTLLHSVLQETEVVKKDNERLVLEKQRLSVRLDNF